MTWGLALQLQDAPRGPVSLRIARAIVQEIERGRLRPGEQLPGTRKLATQLGVHRKTIIAGFLELERQGWIKARWDESDTGRQTKFYSLTAAGRKHLEREAENWKRLSGAINLVIEET